MPDAHPPSDLWRRALDGDRDAFNESIAPFTDTLQQAAERQLAVERDIVSGEPLAGEAVLDLTPQELVGETLVRAWDLRERFDGGALGMRVWLLGLQTRSLSRVARREERYLTRKAISLDDELPVRDSQDAVQEDFYEFHQPFDVDTYEEVFAGSTPAYPSAPGLEASELSDADGATLTSGSLGPDAHQGVILHDEFDVSLSEVAQILNASLKDAAAEMNLARQTLSARLGSIDDAHDDEPAVDSYTGDPLPDA